jgi:GNAT superfamily N-acetyltransferase
MITAGAKGRFLRQVTLGPTGTRVTVRPMAEDDSLPSAEFHSRIPAEERCYPKQRLSAPTVMCRSVREIDYERSETLVGLVGERVVAEGTLYHPSMWARQRVGQVRLAVEPAYRNHGLGRLFLQALADIAGEAGLQRIVLELVEGKQDAAIRVAERVGFTREATFHRCILDTEGRRHDVAVMELQLDQED